MRKSPKAIVFLIFLIFATLAVVWAVRSLTEGEDSGWTRYRSNQSGFTASYHPSWSVQEDGMGGTYFLFPNDGAIVVFIGAGDLARYEQMIATTTKASLTDYMLDGYKGRRDQTSAYVQKGEKLISIYIANLPKSKITDKIQSDFEKFLEYFDVVSE